MRRAQGNLWKRKGWKEMDKMRSRLEDLKELRDLVRFGWISFPPEWNQLSKTRFERRETYLSQEFCGNTGREACQRRW